MKPVSTISTVDRCAEATSHFETGRDCGNQFGARHVPRSWAAAIAAGTDETPACRMAASCVSS